METEEEMTMLRKTLQGLTISALVGGCAAPVPSTSSSTHWVACKKMSDCDGVPNANACNAGFCTDSDGTRVMQSVSVGKTCDPAAVEDVPVQLGQILGIGKDPKTGITYLADFVQLPHTAMGNEDSAYDRTRVFVSEGGELVRHGELQTPLPQTFDNTVYRWVTYGSAIPTGSNVYSDKGGTSSLGFKLVDDEPTRMLLDAPMPDLMSDAPPTAGTELVLQDQSVLSSFRLKDLPGTIWLTTVSDVDDGSVLVIEHPIYDSTEFLYRVFWGKPEDVHEQRFIRGPNQNSDLVFAVETGDRFTAHFDRDTSQRQRPDGSIVSITTGTLQGPSFNRSMRARFYLPATGSGDVPAGALHGLSFTCL
jgi:hypothetical protein